MIAFTASNTASCTIAAKRAWANGLAGPGPVSIVLTAMSFHCSTTSGEVAATRLDVASELNITAHTMTNARRVILSSLIRDHAHALTAAAHPENYRYSGRLH